MDTLSIGQYLTNGISYQFIKVAFIFLLLSYITSKVFQLMLRDRAANRTPEKGSFSFWWKDNYFSVVLFFLMAFPLIVFTEDLVLWLNIEVIHFTNPMFIYYFLGLIFNIIVERVLKALKLVRNVSK